MSIENFCNKFPPDSFLKPTIAGKQTRESLFDKSLVVILAEELVSEGRDGIREIINKLNPGNTMFELSPSDFQQIPAEHRQAMFANYAAIVFGISVVSLERVLVEREYNHTYFCKLYNSATEGVQLSKVEAGGVGEQKLSQEQMRKIYPTVRQDKTFSLFFEAEGFQALPSILREFLTDSGVTPIIRKSILPLFRERAKFLVGS